MQKIFESNDTLEFKLNNKWQMGELHSINVPENKFQIFLTKDNSVIEHHSSSILLNTLDMDTIISNFSKTYQKDEKIEFYDEESKGWTEGKIKEVGGEFFVINYCSKSGFSESSKIVNKNNLRPITKSQNILKFSLEAVECFDLKQFENLSKPEKYCKKLAMQLIDIFKDEIKFIFFGKNLKMLVFTESKKELIKNKNKENLFKKEIIEGMINICFKHYEEIDKKNQK